MTYFLVRGGQEGKDRCGAPVVRAGGAGSDQQAGLAVRMADGVQEHDALAGGVRGEELSDVVVEEGQSGGAEAKGGGAQVDPSPDDAALQLGDPIAAAAEL